MEEWLDFVDTFSAYVLFQLPWKADDADRQQAFELQWSALRQAVRYVLRYAQGQHNAERIDKCRRYFFKYARLVEQVWVA
jgi:hypothetical protein